MKRAKAQASSKPPGEGEDVSVLRPAISLGHSGAFQIASAFRTGTKEVQQVLLEECDVILECKVCKNLFRGLPNLLAHKRVYCKEKFVDKELYMQRLQAGVAQETETVVVQPQSPPRSKTPDPIGSDPEEDPWDNQYPDDALPENTKEAAKDKKQEDVTDVWSQIQAGSFIGHSSSYQFYTAAEAITEVKKENKTLSKIELGTLAGTSLAVSQKISKLKQDAESLCSESDSASIVSEADSKGSKRRGRKRKASLHELIDAQSECSVPDDGAMIVEPVEAKGPLRMSLRERISDRGYASPLYEKLSKYDDCDVKSLTCLKCKTGYSSLKTLHFHMVSLHSEKRTYYPCLYCDSAFAQLWSLTRHLMKHHRKSKAQVENMRDLLRKKAYTKPVDAIGEYMNPRKPPEGVVVKAQECDVPLGPVGSKGKKKIDQIELASGYSLHRCESHS